MPIYEFRCRPCGKMSSLFFRSYSFTEAACSHCGSSDVFRLVSRFAVLKSEESRLEEMADPSKFGDVDEKDPRSIAQWARKMGKEMGEDLGPEFDEMVDKMEAGEMPEDLAEGGTAPDLG